LWLERSSIGQLPSTPTVARLRGISDGPAGAAETMSYMRQFVQDAIRDPQQKIRDLALQIIGRSGFVGQVRCIQSWVQKNIRYVHDPVDFELVQTPQKTLQWTAGDCDDQSVLCAALLQSIGHPCQLMALGFNGSSLPLEHVLTRTKIGPHWVAAETIKPVPLGFLPPNIRNSYIRTI
jgi:transglutaminase-like putative cysteine protease